MNMNLNDIAAIEQVYIRYCEIIDSKQFDDLVDVFTEDTVGDYSRAYGPDAIQHGLAPLLHLMKRNLGPQSNCGATHHNVLNFRIAVDGDTAKARVNYYAVHRGVRDHEGALYSMWGHYDDDLVRTPAGWRVASRRYHIALTEGPAVTNGPGD